MFGVVALNWLTQLASQATAAIYFNADVVYPMALAEDVLIRGRHFSQWHLTPAPYLFPDLALAMFSRGPFEIELAQYVSAGLQVALLLLGVAVLAHRLERPYAPAALLLGGALLMAGLRPGHEPLSQLWLPAYHTGAVLCAVWSTWLALEAKSGARVALLVLVSLLAGLSDALFVAGWAVPALLISLVWRRGQGDFKPWLFAGLAGIVGAALSRFVLPFRRDAVPMPRFEVPVLRQAAVQAAADWQTFDPLVRFGLPVAVLVLVSTMVLWRRKRPGLALISVLAVLSVLGTVSSIIVTGAFADGAWSRYVLWPLVATALAVQLALPRLAALGWVAWVAFASHIAVKQPLPPAAERAEAECLDALGTKEQATLAISDYWHSKPLTLFAGHVTVAAFQPDFVSGPQLGIVSRQWYRPPLELGLIIVDGLDRAAIDQAVGPASAEATCGSLHVLIYREAARERLRAWYEPLIDGVIGLHQ